MSNLVLECKDSGDFKPHPEGIHPAVCVDVMDLGLVESEYQGQRRMVNKVKLVFESEQKTEDGKPCTVVQELHGEPASEGEAAEFLGSGAGARWCRGEKIDLAKLLGASCTLVISHQQNMVGKTYASIDAVSKPTKRVTPSGTYDPALARQRLCRVEGETGGRSEVRGRRSEGGTDCDRFNLALSPVEAERGTKARGEHAAGRLRSGSRVLSWTERIRGHHP